MSKEKRPENEQTTKPEEENVVSVWYGDNNTKLSRRRQFEGYTFIEVLNDAGKKEMRSIYTGDWYKQELTKKQRIVHILLYLSLWLVGLAALIFALTRYIGVNAETLGALPGFVGLIGYGWVMTGLFNQCTAAKKRTIGDYRASSLRTKRGSIIALCGTALTAILTLIYLPIDGKDSDLHLLAAGCELLAAGTAAAIFLIERRVKYTKERSEDAGKYIM